MLSCTMFNPNKTRGFYYSMIIEREVGLFNTFLAFQMSQMAKKKIPSNNLTTF